MTDDNAAIVTELLRAIDDREWDRVLELLDERSVTRNSSGRIYVGHRGFDNWLGDTAASTSSRHFETAMVRDLADGYVLVVGAEHRDPLRGEAEAIPGAWIYLVVDGRINACMYFRTERDALASITGPGRGEPAVDVIERWVDAFHRDDYDALVGLLHERLRFRLLHVDQDVSDEGLPAFIDALVSMRVRFDDVLVERIDVDEIGNGFAIATTTVRVVDDYEINRRRLAHAVRIVDGRIAEWLPFRQVEAARIAVANRSAGAYG